MEAIELMTVGEVADKLRTSITTVRELIKAGKLPAIKVGREYRIKQNDLETYINTPVKQAA